MTKIEDEILDAAAQFLTNCTCGESYKVRGLSAPDCGGCNFADYMSSFAEDFLRARAKSLQEVKP